MKIVLVIALLSLLLFINQALAIDYILNVTPNSVNASVTNQLLNFTVNNTGTTNITYVEIEVPNNFTLVGSPNSTTKAIPFQDPILGIVIWNDTLVVNGSVEYFWIYVNVPIILGDFNFTFTLNDTVGNVSKSNVTVKVVDEILPTIGEESITPSNNSKYSPSAFYNFTLSASDNVGISSVILSFNSTNYTATASSGNNYRVTLYSLPVGTYEYYWIVNDTSNNVNLTSKKNYTVALADNPITFFLNGMKNQNITIENGTELNITVIAKGNITVTQNGAQIGSISEDGYYYLTPPLSVGIYNYTATATGNANYTENSTGVTYFVKVIYHRPRYSNLVLPSTTAYSPGASYTFKITWFSPDAPLNNITNVSFSFGGSTYYPGIANNSYATYSYTLNDLSAGSYNWQWCAEDTQGEQNCTSGTFTVNQAVPSLNLAGIKTYNVGDNVTIIGFGCPSQLVCQLYMNGTLLSGNLYEFVASSPGAFVFTFNTSGNSNYTSAGVEGTVVILAPQVNVTQTTTTTVTTQTNATTGTNQTQAKAATEFILNETKLFSEIKANQPVVFNISNSSIFKIESIQLMTKRDLSNVKIVVMPSSVPQAIETGKAYAYIEISANVSDNDLKEVRINFQVPKNWIEANGLSEDSISLYRFAGKWVRLETKKISSDPSFVHYQALSPGLSYYAIVGEKGKGFPWFWVWVGIGIAVAAFLIYLFWPVPEYEKLKRKMSSPIQP